jgi:nucleoid DNA-binding protein
MKEYQKCIRKISLEYQIPEDVVEAAVKSIYEYIRYNSKDMVSVRIPKFGLLAVKPNRVKYINENKEKRKKDRSEVQDDTED